MKGENSDTIAAITSGCNFVTWVQENSTGNINYLDIACNGKYFKLILIQNYHLLQLKHNL